MTEIEHLQHLVSNLRRDLQNALMQSRRRGEVIDKCKVALSLFRAGQLIKSTHACTATAWLENRDKIADAALTAIEALEKEGLSK